MSAEPGLDRHAWESEFASLEDGLHDDPQEALPELADLVGRMLEERSAQEGDELVAEYRSAREIADRCRRGLAGPGDVAAAIESLRAIYDTVIAEFAPP